MTTSPSVAATDQATTVGLSAHERRVRGLSNWVRDFPIGQGGINEFEMQQLYGMLPHTDPAAASSLLDELGDQLLIMGGHDQRDLVYREAAERFAGLVEDAVSGDETARRPMSGADLIAAERQRQVEVEGWTPEHDNGYIGDDLALAAACYVMPAEHRAMTLHSGRPGAEPETFKLPTYWPWARSFWKPTPDDRIRELVKAGALIAAEIDRLQGDAR